jgi:hypothetical protein
LAGISAFGSLLILITFLAFRETRRHPYTLVFWLSVCDFLFSIKYIVTAVIPDSEKIQDDYEGCLTQAVAVRSKPKKLRRNGAVFRNIFLCDHKILVFHHLIPRKMISVFGISFS